MNFGFSREWGNRKLTYLLLVGLLIRLGLAWLPEKYLFYLVSDDAYYYFTIARNLGNHGMLSADGITLTNGFHPLWLFLITPIFSLFGSYHWFSIHLVLTVSALFDTAAGFLIYRTLEKLGKPGLGLWGAAFFWLHPFGILHSMNGLETALNSFFLALLAYLSFGATSQWLARGWPVLGTVIGLALLARTDNIFPVLALLAYLFWRERSVQTILKVAAPAVLLVAPWLVYNLISFGTVVQTSGSAYPWHYHQLYLNSYKTYFSPTLLPYLLRQSLYSFAESAFHYGNWVLTIIIAVVLAFRLKSWPARYRPLLWTLAGGALFLGVHLFVRWSMRPWYPQAVFVLTLPVVLLALESVRRYWVGFVVVASLALSGWWVWKWPFRIADRSKVMLKMIEERTPAADRVGVFNSGYLQYFTDKKVINLDGLVNNEVLRYYQERKGWEYFRFRNIRWLVDTQQYLWGIFGQYFGPAADSLLVGVDGQLNISYPGNNVFIIRVFIEGPVILPEGAISFGQLMGPWRERAAQPNWAPLPFLGP
ncbi:MAG: glycosyltransferase family 39 protein [candidate division Zixibacteria bacterium]|nr:glycosyltransferase family 39 protein [candidate division Zixibacteria bacterium]